MNTANGRVMFIRAPKRLSPAQVAAALGSMADDDPRWLAVHQVLDEELASSMLDASSPNPINRDHAAGGVDKLSTLKQRLIDARKPVASPARTAKPTHPK